MMRVRLFETVAALSRLEIFGSESPPTIHTVDTLDCKRFMEEWYVLANIPTVLEKNGFNAVQSYRLDSDGTVETTFRFNEGGFEGSEKIYRSRAFVLDKDTNAHWGMQFVWPFKAEYRVVFLADDYSLTMIGRSKRDYVWVMARAPSIPDADYARLLALLESYGYDIRQVQKVPQQIDSRPPGA